LWIQAGTYFVLTCFATYWLNYRRRIRLRLLRMAHNVKIAKSQA
jgi:hypothetical protein